MFDWLRVLLERRRLRIAHELALKIDCEFNAGWEYAKQVFSEHSWSPPERWMMYDHQSDNPAFHAGADKYESTVGAVIDRLTN